MKTLKTISCLLALSLPALSVTHAQEAGSGSATAVATSDQDNDRHRDFIKKTLRMGEEIVDIADVASSRAVHPQVRTLAGELSTAHTAANRELATLIESKGFRIEDRDTVAERELKKKWNDKSGNEIDGDFLRASISHQEDMIDLLEDGTDSKDHGIAAFSHRHLPAMQSHLSRAKALLQRIN